MKRHSNWFVAAAAVTCAAPALCPNAIAAAATGAAGAADSAAEPTGLQEVVVTARKTEERLQDVPLAIRSYDAGELAKAGTSGLKDISQLTPGLVFQEYSSSFSASPTIRGLTQFDVSSAVANVSTVIDGVYIPRNYSVDIGIADVGRVEVIKGPQSALYGGNAFAGVISYSLAQAPKKPEAEVRLVGGNDRRGDLKIAVGGSAFDGVVALRLNYAKSKFDGTWKNNEPAVNGLVQNVGGHDNETWGASLRLVPMQRLEADVDWFHLNRHENIKPAFNVTSSDAQVHFNCGSTLSGNAGPTFLCGTISADPGVYKSATSPRLPGVVQPIQPGFTSGTDFASARLRFDLTDELHANYLFGNVRSYATEITSSGDNPVTPPIGLYLPGLLTGTFTFGPYFGAQKEGGLSQLGSHEFRLNWDHGPFKALVGYYTSHNTDRYKFNITSLLGGSAVPGNPTNPFDFTGFQFPLLASKLTNDVKAQFGSFAYSFLDSRASVSAEMRHNVEDLVSTDPSSGIQRSKSSSENTPRFTASFKLSPDQLLYASAAQGVKQGGFNPLTAGGFAVPLSQQTFDPEKNWTYELGTKNILLDGRAIINADVFLVKWSNLQIKEQPTLPPNTAPAIAANVPVITLNLGAATSKGFESDGQFAATPHLDLTYALSILDPTFDSGTTSARFLNVCDGVVCPTNDAVAGHTLPRTSKFQFAGGTSWKNVINSQYSYLLHGEVTYQSQQQVEEMNLAQIPARTLVNASASLRAEHWDVTLWGRNIFNKKYAADSFFVLTGKTVGYGVSLGEQATVGLTITAHF